LQLKALKASAKHFDAKKEVFKGLATTLLRIGYAEFSQVLKPRQRQQFIHDIQQPVFIPYPFQFKQSSAATWGRRKVARVLNR
jgi:hypothetical protein